MTIGVVTGMLAEANLLQDLDSRVVAAGGNPDRTLAMARELARSGVTALASFGIAGALDPKLQPGDLVIATGVILMDGQSVDCDGAWLRRARDKVVGSMQGVVAGSSTAVATRAAKSALFRVTGALTVDMESHHVAVVARQHNLPFLIIRAVADTAADDLPDAALVGLNEEGRPAIGAVLRSLLVNPRQLPALIRVALRSRVALDALLRGRAGLL